MGRKTDHLAPGRVVTAGGLRAILMMVILGIGGGIRRIKINTALTFEPAMADTNDNQEEFQNCLEQILNYSRSQINTLINDGFESALDVIGWKHKEIKD